MACVQDGEAARVLDLTYDRTNCSSVATMSMRDLTYPKAGSQLAFARFATALAVVSVGALAIGALAIGRLVIKRLAVEAATVKRLRIEEVEVGRLRVRELIRDE